MAAPAEKSCQDFKLTTPARFEFFGLRPATESVISFIRNADRNVYHEGYVTVMCCLGAFIILGELFFLSLFQSIKMCFRFTHFMLSNVGIIGSFLLMPELLIAPIWYLRFNFILPFFFHNVYYYFMRHVGLYADFIETMWRIICCHYDDYFNHWRGDASHVMTMQRHCSYRVFEFLKFNYAFHNPQQWLANYNQISFFELMGNIMNEFTLLVQGKNGIVPVLSKIFRLVTGQGLLGCVFATVNDSISKLIFRVLEVFDGFKGDAGLQDITDAAQFVNEYANDCLSILQCEFGKKLSSLFSLIICVPAINSLGLKPDVFMSDEAIKLLKFDYSKVGTFSLPVLIAEHASALILKLVQVRECGFSALYVSRNDHQEFENLYRRIVRNATNFANRTEVVNAAGEPDPFTLEGYFHDCSLALDLADKIKPTFKKVRYAEDRINRQVERILLHQGECMSELKANESRPCPYAIVIHGDPSIGKTTLKDVLLMQLHATDNHTGRYEHKYTNASVYNYNGGDEFYSGFSSAMTSIVLDDIANKNAEITKQTAGNDIRDLIAMVNTQPFNPNMAELHKKGRVPMRCRYIIGTTNCSDLHAHHVYTCPAAVLRRFLFLDAEVKPQYRGANGIGLRGNNDDQLDLNLWNFYIRRHFPTGGGGSSTRFLNVIKSKQSGGFVWETNRLADCVADITDIARFINIDLPAHWDKQDAASAALEHLEKQPRCECGVITTLCNGNCWKANAGEEPLWAFYRMMIWISFILLSYLFDIKLWFIPMKYIFICGFIYSDYFANNVFRLNLIFAIYPTLLYVTLKEIIWPSPRGRFDSIAVHAALYMVSYLPNNFFISTCLSFLPHRVTMVIGKAFFQDWIDKRLIKVKDGYDYFMKVVVADWRFVVVTAMVSICTAVKMMSKLHFEGNAVMSKMPEPTEEEKRRKNYWLRTNNIGIFPNEGSTISSYDLNNQTLLNNVLLIVRRENWTNKEPIIMNCFIVCNNLMVTTHHWYEKYSDMKTLLVDVIRTNKDGSNTKVTMTIDHSNLCVRGDLLFIKHNRLLPGRDMRKFFPSNKQPEINVNCPGTLHSISTIAPHLHSTYPVRRIAKNTLTSSYVHNGKQIRADNCFEAHLNTVTGNGWCGSPYICEQGTNKMVIGIHCASPAGKMEALIQPLYREIIDEVLENFEPFVLNDADNDIAWVSEDKGNLIVPVHEKCPTKSIDGEYAVIGGSSLPRFKPRTCVGASLFQADAIDYYKDKGYPNGILHTSPIKCSPSVIVKNNMNKVVTNASFIPSDIDFVVEAMSMEFIRKLTPEALARLTPYPYSVAVNGCDGIPYLERLNLKTSGGYAHPGAKRKLFELGESNEFHEWNYHVTPELQKEIDYIVDCYLHEKEANPVFKCNFKDEPITFEKEKINKVRIFSGSPVAFSLVMRKYLMCIIREFVGAQRTNFEMAIGANAYGYDWEEIYNRVKMHGTDRCFAGDYKSFDKQMPPEIILAAFRVICSILAAAGWDDQLLIIRGIATDIAFPTTDLFGTLVQLYGSNPSGHVLTTPINSLANSIYMRLAVKDILIQHNYNVGLNSTYDVDFTHFDQIMSLVTYGDDNCGSISAKYPMITHTSIMNALANYGIVYTMDQKDAESKGLVNINDISFLKRKFVYSAEFGRILAPLDHDSIFKMLTVWTLSKSISREEQACAVLQSANAEYFMYGKDVFEERHSFLCNLVLKYDLAVYLPKGHLLSYLELKSQLGFE